MSEVVLSILEGNAQEIGHITNQLTLTRDQLREVSLFLNCSNEDTPTNYNTKLERIRTVLRQIPHHEKFIDNLHDMPVIIVTKSTLVSGRYVRKGSNADLGKPIPTIFERNTSILGARYTISPLSIYIIKKPLGYDFPMIIHEDGMTFVLCEILPSKPN